VLAGGLGHGPDAAAADPEDQVERLMSEAGAARKAGDLDKAVTLLEELYKLKPMAVILNNLGRLYVELGWYAEAVAAYQKVADDTEADMKLRALDTTRLVELKPKLGRAWLKIAIHPDGSRLWIDGREPERWQADEVGLAPGKHVLEMREAKGNVAHLMEVSLPTDRRTTMNVDLKKLTAHPRGAINLSGEREALKELRLNGVVVAQPLAGLDKLTLPAGEATLELVFKDDKTVSEVLDVQPGEASALQIAAPKALPKAPLPVVPEAVPESNTLSWILIGVGAAAAAAGGGLLIDGTMSSSKLNDAMANQSPVTSFSQKEAQELRERANLEGTVGLAALSVGMVALIMGMIVSLSGPSQPEAAIKQVEAPLSLAPGLDGSVRIRWRF